MSWVVSTEIEHASGSSPTHNPKLTAQSSQLYLFRHLQILQKHLLRLQPQRAILDHGIELVVDRDAERVEVGGSDTHPVAVDDARLRVHHHTLPLPDPHAVLQQPPVHAAREPSHPGMVVLARD